MLYPAVYSLSSLSSVFRPYVFAVHSEQPDTFGHRLGPLSSEVSVKTSFITSVSRSCFLINLIPASVAGQPAEGDRQHHRSADERSEADEPASLHQRHRRGRPRYDRHTLCNALCFL